MRYLIPLIAALVMLGGCSKKKKTLSDEQATTTILKSLESEKMCCPVMSLVKAKVIQRGKVTKGRHAIRAKLFFMELDNRIKHTKQGTVDCEVFKNKFSEWKAECKKVEPVPRSYSRVPYNPK